MAQRCVILLLFVALVLPATSAAPSTTWPATSTGPGPLLGLVYEGAWRLARIEPDSLEPTGRRVYVGPVSGSWAFSPDRSLLAVAAQTSTGRNIVRLVDPVSLSQRSRVPLAYDPGTVAWPVRYRVLALSPSRYYAAAELVSYDPLARRVVRRTKITGTLLRTARTPDGLALLLAPANDGMGQARLALVDANGAVRTTALDLIAGWTQPDGEPYVFEQRVPGLAVDPQGGRLFVVPAENRALEVELATLTVRERALSQQVSLFGRLHDWLEPAAEAKASDGPWRYARWLGGGMLAVTGTDGHATVRNGRIERQEWRAAGLKLIDTSTWSLRTVDERVSSFVFADGLLLATGLSVTWEGNTETRSSMGLVAYGPYGDARFSLFPGEDPWVSGVIEGRAYVGFGGGPGQTLSVVDLANGRVVGRYEGIVPQLLLGSADSWSG